jgi:hypothetical protein
MAAKKAAKSRGTKSSASGQGQGRGRKAQQT